MTKVLYSGVARSSADTAEEAEAIFQKAMLHLNNVVGHELFAETPEGARESWLNPAHLIKITIEDFDVPGGDNLEVKA